MNDNLFLVFQPAFDSELLHFALAALAAIFACVCSVVGVALGIVVKRAIAKWFERQDELEKRLEAVERTVGISAITGSRVADGHSDRVL